MKFSNLSLGLFAGVALAAPTPTIDNEANLVNRAAATTPIGYASLNGGTTGGAGGTTTTVSTYAQFTAAVAGTNKAVVYVSAPISTAVSQVKIGSNKSIIGKSSKVIFTGFGVLIKAQTNVIFRNIAIAKVLAENGDAIGVQDSTNVWIDHVDLSSDLAHDKDYYDGLLDVSLPLHVSARTSTKLTQPSSPTLLTTSQYPTPTCTITGRPPSSATPIPTPQRTLDIFA